MGYLREQLQTCIDNKTKVTDKSSTNHSVEIDENELLIVNVQLNRYIYL